MGAESVLVGLRVRGFRTELDGIQRRDIAAERLEGENGDFVADVAVVPAIMSGCSFLGRGRRQQQQQQQCSMWTGQKLCAKNFIFV